MPDGVLINGKGPFQYNTTLVPSGIDYEKITVDPGIIISPFVFNLKGFIEFTNEAMKPVSLFSTLFSSRSFQFAFFILTISFLCILTTG